FLELREALNKKDKEILRLRDELVSHEKGVVDLRDRSFAMEKANVEMEEKLDAQQKSLGDAQQQVQSLKADKEQATKRGDDDARVQQLDELRRELEAANAETMSARDKQHAEEAARLRAEHEAALHESTDRHARELAEAQEASLEARASAVAKKEQDVRAEAE